MSLHKNNKFITRGIISEEDDFKKAETFCFKALNYTPASWHFVILEVDLLWLKDNRFGSFVFRSWYVWTIHDNVRWKALIFVAMKCWWFTRTDLLQILLLGREIWQILKWMQSDWLSWRTTLPQTLRKMSRGKLTFISSTLLLFSSDFNRTTSA